MKHSIVYSLICVFFAPLIIAASCQTESIVQGIRNTHTPVREAFAMMDEFVAPRFDAAGDQCIEAAESRADADRCMRPWLRLDEVLGMSREALAELENVYNSIEAGAAGETDWQHWARQLLTHGRGLLRILDELDIDGADETISSMSNAIDQLCQLIGCEGGE